VLQDIGEAISEVVDFKASVEQRRTAVVQGVDTELDGFKRTYDGMESLLNEAHNMLLTAIPEWAAQYVQSCLFYPQLGFLTAVELEVETGAGKYEGEGTENDIWEKMFVSNNVGYYKNNGMRGMDEYFGDLYGLICGKFTST
jgi:DNA mismatch repair protein MSH5